MAHVVFEIKFLVIYDVGAVHIKGRLMKLLPEEQREMKSRFEMTANLLKPYDATRRGRLIVDRDAGDML